MEYLYVAIIILIVIVLYIIFFTKAKEPIIEEEVEVEDDAIKKLLRLNILVRKNTFESDLRDLIEQLIDDLRRITPAINERFKGSEMSWVINKMSDKYLPELVTPYLALSQDAQDKQKEKFVESLSSIDKELKEVEAMLNSSDKSDFESKARFIKHRFQ